jgi:hypothetical protein
MKKSLFNSVWISILLINVSYAQTSSPNRILSKKNLSTISLKEIRKNELKKEKIVSTNQSVSTKYSNKKTGSNGTESTTIQYSDLGKSVNPFTSISSGRNYLSVNNSLNTVALFRRGSESELPLSQSPGNKLYYDLNTKGGTEGKWQIARNKLYDNSQYNFPGFESGARYPQGLIWNPPGNLDTNSAIAFGQCRVLDGSNGSLGWGGVAKGWASLSSSTVAKQTLWSSQAGLESYFHFAPEALITTPNGSIFCVEAENDLSSDEVVFIDKILIIKYNYNSSTSSFDSTITQIPFVNSGQAIPTDVGSTQIAFGPDGQTGYAIIAGYNPDFNSTLAYIPYYSKTTNGGGSWSPFKMINFNKTEEEKPYRSPEKDNLRSQLLGNYVVFHEDGSISEADSSTQPFSHPVDYTIMQMDLSVDKNNFAHLFSTLAVASFGDTLLLTGLGVVRPGFGSWQVDIFVNPNSDTAKGFLVNSNFSFQGKWGDVDTDVNISDFNRPNISRSEDGSVIVFSWLDTDTAKFPQRPDFNNANPDLWVREMRITEPENFKLHGKSRNMTKGSDYDGLAILATAAPTLINRVNGFQLAASTTLLSDFTGETSPWEIQHLFVSGINIAPATEDTVYTVPTDDLIILKTKDVVNTNRKDKELRLFPNPGTGYFTANIKAEKSGIAFLKIIDSNGQSEDLSKISLPAGESFIPINIKRNPPGLYLIQIELNGKVFSSRIVKN